MAISSIILIYSAMVSLMNEKPVRRPRNSCLKWNIV